MLELVAIASLLWIAYWFLVATKHPPGFPNGPRFPLPVAGDALALGGNMFDGFNRLRRKYGDVYGMYLGPNRTVVVSDFDLIQEVGSNEAFQDRQNFPVGTELRGGLVKSGDGTTVGGVIFTNGPNWVEQRRFALHKLRDLGFGKSTMEALVSDEVSELIRRLEKTEGKPVNIRNDFTLAVLNSLWKITTNERLDYEDPKICKLVSMIDQMFQEFGNPLNTLMFLYKPLYDFLKATKLSIGPTAITHMLDFFENTVKEHEDTFQEDSLRDFTDHYLNEMRIKSASDEESSFKGSDGRVNLVNCLMDFFVAGGETTSTTLNWGMLYMILNPDIQAKVQAELDEVTGRGRLPCLADREATPYTEAVIHELQRCGNVVPFGVVHHASRDAYLGGKYFIPKGTDIFPNLGSAMHDPRHFPEPDRFDPTRHLTKDGKFEPNPLIIPFGVGKRRCLGENLARMSLYLFFTGLLSNFTLMKQNEGDHLSTKPQFGSTMTPLPYKMLFKARK